MLCILKSVFLKGVCVLWNLFGLINVDIAVLLSHEQFNILQIKTYNKADEVSCFAHDL